MKKQNKAEKSTENQIQTIFHFPTAIYTIDKPEFLPTVKKVTTEFLKKAKKQISIKIDMLKTTVTLMTVCEVLGQMALRNW